MKTETLYSTDPELFRDSDMAQVVNDHADGFQLDEKPPFQFTVYERVFARMPASHYLPHKFHDDIIEMMDERAYEILSEYSHKNGLFADMEINSAELEKDLKSAIDAVFTKHGLQPDAMCSMNQGAEHTVEWSGPNDWRVVEASA